MTIQPPSEKVNVGGGEQFVVIPVTEQFVDRYTSPTAIARWGSHYLRLRIGDTDLGEWTLESVQAFQSDDNGRTYRHTATLRRVGD